MQGWIKLHRELLQKPIWKCSMPEQKIILITILLLANHDENEWIWQGEKYMCKSGQFITSLESLASESGTSIRNVRTALNNFEKKYDFLTNKSTKTGRLVTVTNWALYQSDEPTPTNKPTKHRQSTDKAPTTNKNDKNDKNDKNNKNIYAEFVSMTEVEYQKLIDEHGEANTLKFIDTLNRYKGANGKKYKSDYMAILNWVVEKVCGKQQERDQYRRVD